LCSFRENGVKYIYDLQGFKSRKIGKRRIFMAEIKFEIKENIGKLSESAKGWKKELNLISWNDNEPKYDVRDWDPEHKKMGKGITFSSEELKALRDILNGMEL
jgi:hypothetical protein